MKKVIITGGAGYIGTHTAVKLVEAGLEPIIVDDLSNSSVSSLDGLERIIGRRPVFHQVDCQNEKALQEVFAQHPEAKGVIHFAACKSVSESVQDPLKYYSNNIGSTATLLKVMKHSGVMRLVFSSSCTVYGMPDELPVTEHSPTGRATSPYGYSKVVCEQMLRDVRNAWPELDVVMLRYFNPIGAHPSGEIGELPLGVPTNLIPYLTQVAAGVRDELVIHGDDYSTADGTCVRDYIHVMDLAHAHVRALSWMEQENSPSCETFNLGTGSGVSVKAVVNAFIECTGVKLPHRYGPRRQGDVEQIWADTTKSQKVLGWRTALTLEQALRDAWNWQCQLSQQSG